MRYRTSMASLGRSRSPRRKQFAHQHGIYPRVSRMLHLQPSVKVSSAPELQPISMRGRAADAIRHEPQLSNPLPAARQSHSFWRSRADSIARNRTQRREVCYRKLELVAFRTLAQVSQRFWKRKGTNPDALHGSHPPEKRSCDLVLPFAVSRSFLFTADACGSLIAHCFRGKPCQHRLSPNWRGCSTTRCFNQSSPMLTSSAAVYSHVN